MASRLEELALEGLRRDIEVAERIMEEKVLTTCESLINPNELREELTHLRGVLELDNVTSLSTLVSDMKNEDMGMMWHLGKNFEILVKIILYKAPTIKIAERTFSFMGW